MIVTPEQLLHLATGPNVESRLIRRSGSRWSVEHAPLAPARIDKLPAKQWTVLVQGLEQYVPAARMLLDRFNFVPYARLDDLMASYATSGGGVGPHYDSYDVFLVQAYGRRTWRIGPLADDTLLDAPLKLLARFIPEQEFLLEPGDMLYLPPRWAHDGVAEDECITLSIGFRAPDAREFAGQLRIQLVKTSVTMILNCAQHAIRRQSRNVCWTTMKRCCEAFDRTGPCSNSFLAGI